MIGRRHAFAEVVEVELDQRHIGRLPPMIQHGVQPGAFHQQARRLHAQEAARLCQCGEMATWSAFQPSLLVLPKLFCPIAAAQFQPLFQAFQAAAPGRRQGCRLGQPALQVSGGCGTIGRLAQQHV